MQCIPTQVYLSKCEVYLGTSTCLMVTRGKLYADEIYVYVRNKPGYVLSEGATESGKVLEFVQTRVDWTVPMKKS
jgi:hypothetical protein